MGRPQGMILQRSRGAAVFSRGDVEVARVVGIATGNIIAAFVKFEVTEAEYDV